MLDHFHSMWDFGPGMGLPTFRTVLLWLNLSGDSLTDTQVHLLANPNLIKLTLKIDNNSLTTLRPKCGY